MRKNTKFKVPKSLIPSSKKIMTRAAYEMMWEAQPRNYGKRVYGSKKNEN